MDTFLAWQLLEQSGSYGAREFFLTHRALTSVQPAVLYTFDKPNLCTRVLIKPLINTVKQKERKSITLPCVRL